LAKKLSPNKKEIGRRANAMLKFLGNLLAKTFPSQSPRAGPLGLPLLAPAADLSALRETSMDASLLTKLFGRDQKWQGPCTVILTAEAALRSHGADSIGAGGVKIYAPRTVSGRIPADAVNLLHDSSALLLVQQQKVRQDTGEENIKQSLIIVDPSAVAAVEFENIAALAELGIAAPTVRSMPGSFSHQGMHPKPG
jgi:hypothetical protein